MRSHTICKGSDQSNAGAGHCSLIHAEETPHDGGVASEHISPLWWCKTLSIVHMYCESTSASQDVLPAPGSVDCVQIAAVPELVGDVLHLPGPEW
jgi:hypothetical protein